MNFLFLLAEQVLFVSSHFFIFDFQYFLMCFFCFEVETGFLAFFAIVFEEFEKFDHVIVGSISGYKNGYL